jgi:hypothetical protein
LFQFLLLIVQTSNWRFIYFSQFIQKYLDYYGFDMTLEKFNEECINKGKTIANVDKKNSSNQKINTIMVRL